MYSKLKTHKLAKENTILGTTNVYFKNWTINVNENTDYQGIKVQTSKIS